MRFNTEMVRAILAKRKTVTRLIIKPQPKFIEHDTSKVYACKDMKQVEIKPPYKIGDVVWVNETWKHFEKSIGKGESCHIEKFIAYKADEDDNSIQKSSEWFEGKWQPSSRMKKESARIFLKITDIRIEQLQEITETQAIKEGFKNGGLAEPWITATNAFIQNWDGQLKSHDRDTNRWGAMPRIWVWVIEFEIDSNLSKI